MEEERERGRDGGRKREVNSVALKCIQTHQL